MRRLCCFANEIWVVVNFNDGGCKQKTFFGGNRCKFIGPWAYIEFDLSFTLFLLSHCCTMAFTPNTAYVSKFKKKLDRLQGDCNISILSNLLRQISSPAVYCVSLGYLVF